ncbi:hypothetical protein HPB49_008138 [Dermacentor silvarum]|uniref:Uncharacterized protein n=1 Tax=Dermacentor silvarum TaxID=543639 RepID=A0ACB8D3V6_DERSI|nr:hypothetical protein HPB49_008138 [Dermacentor silvarum]
MQNNTIAELYKLEAFFKPSDAYGQEGGQGAPSPVHHGRGGITMTMEITVEGTVIEPIEMEGKGWVVKLKKCVEKLRGLKVPEGVGDAKTASHSGGGEEAGCKVAGAESCVGVRSYKAVERKIAERSVATRLPKLPDDGWKWEAKLAAEPEEEKAPKTALQQQQQVRCSHHDGARDRSKSTPRDHSASFPRLTPSTREEASSRPEQQSKSSQKSAPPNSQVGWVDKGSQDSAMVKALKEQNRLMQEQIRTMQAQYNNMQELNRELREQIILLNKRIDEGAQKAEKEGSQSVSETPRADPPPKKKRVKDLETVNNYDQRFDKIEQDMKLLHGMIQQMNEQMRAEAANRDGQWQWLCQEIQKFKDGPAP